MSQDLKAGSRWRSTVCDTEVVVVRAPSEPAQLECGGTPMLPVGSDPEQGSSPDPQWSDGTLIGKRYELNAPAIEILCTKAGLGSLSIAGVPLTVKGSKPLPASD
jgi:hypothetical protein